MKPQPNKGNIISYERARDLLAGGMKGYYVSKRGQSFYQIGENFIHGETVRALLTNGYARRQRIRIGEPHALVGWTPEEKAAEDKKEALKEKAAEDRDREEKVNRYARWLAAIKAAEATSPDALFVAFTQIENEAKAL